MKLGEHLLTIIGEEGAEIAQRATKALRFGLDEREAGFSVTNRERLVDEVNDLCAVLELAELIDALWYGRRSSVEARAAKKEKVAKYLDYSRDVCGTLSE